MNKKTLIVITGPTAIGKSRLALSLAQRFNTEIISADSRQVYRNMPIATAAPTKEELSSVHHHLVGFLNPEQYYSAALFEEDALRCADDIWTRSDIAIACGGSMMYVDALCHGIDPLPTVPAELRAALMRMEELKGFGWTLHRLRDVDPASAQRIDIRNPKRVFHALEISLAAGKPYSELCTGKRRQRPFRIIKLMLTAPREVIFDRIARRTDQMIEAGLEDEARSLYPMYEEARSHALTDAAAMRRLNALNTVGLKEMFYYFDKKMTFDEAVEKIKRNTRVYAKKQLTWFARDTEIIKVDALNPDAILSDIL